MNSAEERAEKIEVWKPSLEGPYLISDKGRIMHSKTGEIQNPKPYRDGYLRSWIYMWNGSRKRYSTATLVAKTFIGPRPDDLTVNHKNGIKTDNRPENLEYMTRGDNARHAVANGLSPVGEDSVCAKPTKAQAITVLKMHFAKRRHVDIAKKYGLDKSTIDKLCSGRTWKSLEAIRARKDQEK
jgi:HNH endonuclease